ncbi:MULTISPECIES: recombinase family protein [unclassified Cryobacterium]|uniref:recombinase family protein n=1 Tax=unclassified Cryobacterium TaxID=2649013 RepID=UPI002B22E240|nr:MULTISPECIES: recombinase family protein [Cryobacterium]MEB0303854.1 recombinase family protein [Cryobacterium sp. 10I1]MEC5148759.1 DNA invertase Pin-like site-specific DNA recombinase [Cryobacterium psychrotolerans]
MRAAIYCRISMDSAGEGLGVERQRQDCIVKAAKLEWDVAGIYVDNDVSASSKKPRPQFERMLADVRSGAIQAIVAYSIDRLTRKPMELEGFINMANDLKLELATTTGEIDLSTPVGRMMARTLGTIAGYETEAMSTRLKRKFLQKAQAGEPHGYAPYGYARTKDSAGIGQDKIHPEYGAVVREAAERILALESLRSVVTDFNARGIHGPKAPLWNSTILRQILLRPTNAGLRQYQGRIIGQSTTEPLYDQATYERLVALLKDPARRSNHVGPGFKYLLSGLALCGLCGGVMRRQIGRTVVSEKTGATKRQPPAYNCSICYKVRRHQEAVDASIVELVVGRLGMPDAIDLFATSDSGVAEKAQSAIDAVNAKDLVVSQMFMAGEITREQLRSMTAASGEARTKAQRMLDTARPSTPLAHLTGGDVQQKWDELDMSAQRDVVARLLTVVIMTAGSGTRYSAEDLVVVWND